MRNPPPCHSKAMTAVSKSNPSQTTKLLCNLVDLFFNSITLFVIEIKIFHVPLVRMSILRKIEIYSPA